MADQLARGLWANFQPRENPFDAPNGMEDNLRLIDDHLGLYTLSPPQAPGTPRPLEPEDGAGQIYTDGTAAVYNAGEWRLYPPRKGLRAVLASGTDSWLCSGTGWEQYSVIDTGPATEAAQAAADTAAAFVNRRPDTATALADSTIPDPGWFSTPSTVQGEAAIIYRKLGGAAIESSRVPSSALVLGLVADFFGLDAVASLLEQTLLRRDGVAAPFCIQDAAGNVGLLIDEDAGVHVRDIVLPETRPGARDAFAGGVMPLIVLRYEGGEGALLYLTPEQLVAASSGMSARFIEARGTPAGDRDGYAANLLLAAQAAGKDLYPYLWHDGAGRLDFTPAESLLAKFTLADGVWRGAIPSIGPVRPSGAITKAAVQDDDGRVYDARQRTEGGLATFVAARTEPLLFLGFMGQSNSGAPAVYPSGSYSATPYPGHVLQYSGAGIACTGFELQSAAALVDLAPVGDDGQSTNNFLASLTGHAYEYFARRAGGPSRGVFTHTSWSGGMPLSHFANSSGWWWSNAIQARQRASVVAGLYGRGVREDWMVWVQGEGGEYGRTAHATALSAFIDAFRPAARDAIGQAALANFGIVQTNVGDYPDAEPQTTNMESTALAHWDLARSRAADGIRLLCPMYQCPQKTVGDNIHTILVGRLLLSETIAAAIEQEQRTGTAWKPLWPTSAVLSGSTITVTFDVPGGGLAWDTDWVGAIANRGFAYTDSTDSVQVTGVSIVGQTVQVALSGAPTGTGRRLQYAVGKARDAVADSWASGRGQLFSPTSTPSRANRLGFAVPATVRHYCIKFDMEITS